MLHEAGNCNTPSVHALAQPRSICDRECLQPFLSSCTLQVDTNETPAAGEIGGLGAVA